MEANQIKELEEKMQKLQSQVDALSGAFYKNNFSSSQSFNKACVFSERLRVPVFSGAPSVAEVGDLIAVGGVLYICTDESPVTFTVVGTQT